MTETLAMMEVVNRFVRAGDLGSSLADTLLCLCQHLKQNGQQMELTNKNALNAVFVSLRQAACRDAGQLGSALRLRLMELIELRAMHWRPSLQHSAYYSKQPTLSTASNGHHSSPAAAPPPPPPPLPLPLPTPLLLPSGASLDGSLAPPPLYLLPAALGNLAFLAPFLNPHLAIEDARRLQKKAAKPPPLRHEMNIRNADSGKLMGVKGRRVALVEQLSGTVISFQKVADGAAKSKMRVLTITANDEEAIERAVQLIEDTIRRNASPVDEKAIRGDHSGEDSNLERVYSREELLALSSPSSLSSLATARISSVAPEILRIFPS